jgi:hypothetical protein
MELNLNSPYAFMYRDKELRKIRSFIVLFNNISAVGENTEREDKSTVEAEHDGKMCGRHQYLYFHGEATRKFANKLKASSDH